MGERVPPELDPKDERLLEEDYSDKTDVKRSMRYNASNAEKICSVIRFRVFPKKILCHFTKFV